MLVLFSIFTNFSQSRTTSEFLEQENEHALPGSISAVAPRGVKRLWSFEQTAGVGIGADVSTGIALSGTAGLAQISALLALVLQQQEQTVFQRLREWYLDGKHKSGKKRRELEVSSCFAPLLRWIVQMTGEREPADGAGAGCHDAGRAASPFCRSVS